MSSRELGCRRASRLLIESSEGGWIAGNATSVRNQLRSETEPVERIDIMTESSTSSWDGEIPPEWLAEFEAAARRPLSVRLRYAFIKTYKPVLDDASYRSFDTMADYRRWCGGTYRSGSVMAARLFISNDSYFSFTGSN